MLLALGVFFGAYLIGSIPFGLILTKLAGLGDIRRIGSGNIGATNVLRTGRKGLAALTLLLDGLKGVGAVLLFATHPAIAAAGVVTGHIFPLWLRGKGGKGVATYIGVAFALSPLLGAVAVGVWLVTALVSRFSSLSALVMLVAVPIAAVELLPSFSPVLTGLSLLIGYRHKENIQRLISGTEPRIRIRRSEVQPDPAGR